MNFRTKPYRHITVTVYRERAELYLGVEKVRRLFAATRQTIEDGEGALINLTVGRRSFAILKRHRAILTYVLDGNPYEGHPVPAESGPTEEDDVEGPAGEV